MITLTNQESDWIEIVVNTLKNGGLVVHPTDTAYGIAVDATNPDAIERVYQIKHRTNKPLIIVVKNLNQASQYVEIIPNARKLAGEFFPGALTLVLPSTGVLPRNLTPGTNKIGVRQPDSPITQAISTHFPNPYTSTSANLTNGPTPYSPDEVLTQLDPALIDVFIDIGTLPLRPTSTVVDLTVDPPRILRKGPITASQINSRLTK